MPSTTTNGLPIPLDSDPVSDTALAIQQLAEALDAGLLTSWTTYAATWTVVSGTNPAIGNGAIVAAYQQVGSRVTFRVQITAGSTTTYGSGQYRVSLPVAAASGATQLVLNALDDTGATYSGQARISSASSYAALGVLPAAAGGQDRSMTATVPVTMGTGDVIVVCGTYEAA